jgi:hypothetical protein
LDSQAVGVGATEVILFVVPPITVNTVTGNAIQDRLPADNVIYNLSQILITALSTHAGAEATSVLTVRVRRAGVEVGGGPFAGWIDGAAPALTAWEPLAIPYIPSNTAVLRPLNSNTPISATQAVAALQPLDVVTVQGNIPTDFNSFFTVDGE